MATILPAACYKAWSEKAELHQRLAGTVSLFDARDAAWEAVQAVARSIRVPTEAGNRITHGGIEMDFAVARHLTLTSYVTITWSIYDRLASVCGKLAAVAQLSGNQRRNLKILEDLLGDRSKKRKGSGEGSEEEESDKGDFIGFGLQRHLKEAYAWPLRVSYKVRNWLVHEGYEIAGHSMFKGVQIVDGFVLHDRAIKAIEIECFHSLDGDKIVGCCLSAADERWQTKDLLQVLKQYHGEVDTMFGCLLKWAVDSFVGQIHAFAERDSTSLALLGGKVGS
ncbi:MAG TPA: hypothetical protein VHI13_10735 [Candidatus Kapabacteria bacterium]|nr:hypothetical protein [Candidatus Kapabacteria bacterium]